MDPYDATNVLFGRIKSLDPDNASKVMGFILIQDLPDVDLMRFAFGPETLLHSLVLKAKAHLGLSSNTLSTSPSLNPISRPNASNPNNSHNPLPLSSPRLIPRNDLLEFSKKPPPPWSPSTSPKSSPFLSYDNIRSGSFSLPSGNGDSSADLIDESQMSDYLSFLNDSSSSKNDDFVGHRRSFSASDACFGSAEEASAAGLGGFRTCLYFARGFCKNGDNCKFSHGGLGDSNVDFNGGGVVVGSPTPTQMELLYHQHQELMRMRAAAAAAAAHQQRLAAAHLMAGVSSPLPYDKNNFNFLLQHHSDAHSQRAAALMLGEEICKFRPDRNDLFAMGLVEKANAASKQIYLTFPAESTFKDEDVSNYFSMFGPVHDVRIPYQQKRMFGFVTFVHAETVKLILARGNPHYICDSRVLVKPYKEKGKLPDKRQHLQQQFERGNFSPCSSPSGLDSREPHDLHAGAKMFYNPQEIMMRKKLEAEADLHQAIELQRRFTNLQLPDFKNEGIHHHQRSLSLGAYVSLPAYSHAGQNINPSGSVKQEVSEVNCDDVAAAVPSTTTLVELEEVNSAYFQKDEAGNAKECSKSEGCHESNVEHALPDSLFASPKKPTENHVSDVPALVEVNDSPALCATSAAENDPSLLITSTSDMASIKISS